MQLNDEYGFRVLGGPRAALLIDVEERARAGRRVDGAGGSAVSKDHDDDDDEQERERAAEAGGERHGQRCVTCKAGRDREPNAHCGDDDETDSSTAG
jgi:hypothetical protein